MDYKEGRKDQAGEITYKPDIGGKATSGGDTVKKFIPVNAVLLLCNRKLTIDHREELLYPVIK